MKSNMKRWFGSLMVLVILLPMASAFGVSSPYWTDNPIVMEPGETREVTLSLQNMLGGEDLTLQAELSSDIARIADSDLLYEVGFGERHVPVSVVISVPESASIGSGYDVLVTFKEVKESEGSFVGLSAAVATRIPVQVGEEPSPEIEIQLPEPQPEPSNNYLLIGLVLIALLAIIGYLYKKK